MGVQGRKTEERRGDSWKGEKETLWSREEVRDEEESEGDREAEGKGEKRVSFPLQFALLTAGKLISLNQSSDEATLQFKTFQGSGLLTSRGPSTRKCWEPCKTHRKYG